MKPQPVAIVIKYKEFSYYQQKYFRKLNQPNSLIEPLNQLCGGWFLETFKQVVNKLSTNKSSPLPLFFPSIESMQLITKNKVLLRQVFTSFDTRNLGRIDACELYCALIAVSKGSYQIFLKTIVDVFGFQFQGRILKDQFFFFLDSFFRAIPKIVIIKGYSKPIDPNIRLQHDQINGFIKTIFIDKDDIQRNQIYQAMLRHPKLNQFIKYIQKRCSGSAEKCRNQVIERVNLQSQIRNLMHEMIKKVEQALNYNQNKKQNYQKILQS